MPLPIAVLASGRGTNFAALQREIEAGRVDARIVLLLSDRPGAAVLGRAEAAGIPARVLPPREFPDRAAHDRAILAELRACGAELVVLAGYMRILGPEVIAAYRNRILNVHPALLPAFPGLDAQRQAWEYGVKVSGCTVHFVDEGVDSGPIVLQAAVPVVEGDDPDALAARILAEEHRLLPRAVALFAEGRLRVEGRRVRILGDRKEGAR